MKTAIAVLLAIDLAVPCLAGTIHVDRSNPNCPGSGTQADPFCTIQAAIDVAVSGDTILVAPGTYDEQISYLGKSLVLKSEAGPQETTIHWESYPGAVLLTHGEKAPVLEGFTVDGWNDAYGRRGSTGVACDKSSPRLTRNVFTGMGTAVSGTSSGSLELESNTFRNNDAVLLTNSCSVTFESNLVTGNGGPVGWPFYGLAYIDDAPAARIHANVFEDNENLVTPCLRVSGSPATIDGNSFAGNPCGLYIWGPAVVLRDNTFTGNGPYLTLEAEGGIIEDNRFLANDGAIWLKGGATLPLQFVRNLVADNPIGDGVVCGRFTTIADCTVSGNRWYGIYDAGGGIVRNCTIVGNGGAGLYSETYGEYATHVESSIVRGNNFGGPQILFVSAAPVVTFSDVEGGWPGPGNLDADPLFADPASGDFSLTWGSPCIDAGDPAFRSCERDLGGHPRVLDGLLRARTTVDMGALEWDHVRLTLAWPDPDHVTLATDGTSGLRAYLFAGLGAGVQCMPPFGALFLDLSRPWVIVPFGTIPSSLTTAIPDLPPSTEIVLQALATRPVGDAGNLSNDLVMRIP